MKILIAGICGFVGHELVCGLVEFGTDPADIVGFDNLSRAGSWFNHEKLKQMGVRFLHGDIRNASDLERVPRVDCVIDAAANAAVMAGVDGVSTSRQLVENNLYGTVNLLELCKRFDAGFVLLSTSRVYAIQPLADLAVTVQGNAFVLPLHHLPFGMTQQGVGEVFSTAAPVSLYGATKLASEQLALEYGRAFEFPVWINRCSVMAGAGQFARADQGIFSFWLHSWKENRPLKYIGFDGKGHQVRDCLHPRDIVSLLSAQMKTSNDGRPAVVNVSGGATNSMSLAQLSDWCSQRWGKRQIGIDLQSRPYDLPWVVLDHSLATDTWGWQPNTAIEQTLLEIAEFAETRENWVELTA